MKKFKNEFGVTAKSKSLLKAFKEEAEKLGWKYNSAFNNFESKLPYFTDMYFDSSTDWGFSLTNCSGDGYILYKLELQWNEALAAASEVEEEMPEYVEILSTYNYDWDKSNCDEKAEINTIYKVKSYSLEYLRIKTNSGSHIAFKNPKENIDYKVASKAAYDAQQQELADKELLEKLIKESGLKIGTEVTWGMKVEYAKIEKFDLVKNVTLNSMKYSPGNSQLAIYLGDYYKWYSTSTDTLEVKPKSKTLTLGDKKIEVKISKGKIEAQSITIPIAYIQEVVKVMTNKNDDGFSWKCVGANWEFKFPSVKIGCSTFTVAELEQIVETYNELNK